MKKDNRYRIRILWLVLFLCFFLESSVAIYTESYQKTLEEQRKTSYGSWDVAVYHAEKNEKEELKKNAIVDKIGVAELAGTVISKEDEDVGEIGIVDANFISIGNIDLLNGKMPEHENEIAVEASLLTKLGYSYELGQKISISLLPNGEENRENMQNHDFYLSGVIKNYSTYWKTESYKLPSFFLSKKAKKFLKEEKEQHVFISLKQKYRNQADDLQVLCQRGQFVKNDYVYQEYSEKTEKNFASDLLQIVILCVCGIAVFWLIQKDIKEQRNNFVIMRMLGATRWQILKIYMRKKRYTLFSSIFVGNILGIFSSLLLLSFLERITTEKIYFCIEWKRFLYLFSLCLLEIALSFLCGLYSILRVPLHRETELQSVKTKFPKKRKKLNRYNLFFVLKQFEKRKIILSILLTFVFASFILIAFYQSLENWKEYKFACETYPDDYTFGMLGSYYELRDTMTSDEFAELKQIYGIREIKSITVSKFYGISFSGKTDSQYKKIVQNSMNQILGENSFFKNKISGCLIGISKNLEQSYFMQSENNLKKENTLEENEVILYLPNYVQTDSVFEEVGDNFYEPVYGKIFSEKKIQVGDNVYLQEGKIKQTLKIVGIIRSFSDDNAVANLDPVKPFSMICSKATYQNICGEFLPSYVTVNTTRNNISYQTDVEMSEINTELYFQNNRIEHEDKLRNFILKVALTIILTIAIFSLAMLIRFSSYATYEKNEIMRYHILYRLGMEQEIIKKYFLLSNLMESIMGIVGGLLTFLGYRFFAEYAIFSELSAQERMHGVTLGIQIGKHIFRSTNWNVVGILLVILLFFNLHIRKKDACCKSIPSLHSL